MAGRFQNRLFTGRLALSIVAVAALTSPFSEFGCGDKDEEQARGTIAAALETNDFPTSGKLKATVQINCQAIQSQFCSKERFLEIGSVFERDQQGRLETFDFGIHGDIGNSLGGAGVMISGQEGFVALDSDAYRVPQQMLSRGLALIGERTQTSIEPGSPLGQATAGIAPLDWIEDPEIKGAYTVRDERTTRVTARINAAAAMGDIGTINERLLDQAERHIEGPVDGEANTVPGRLTSDELNRVRALMGPGFRKLAEQAKTLVVGSDLELYVADDDSLRRLDINLEFKADPGASQTSTISLVVELFDVGEPQEVETPAKALPFSMLERRIQNERNRPTGSPGAADDLETFDRPGAPYTFAYPKQWGPPQHKEFDENDPQGPSPVVLSDQTTLTHGRTALVATAGPAEPELSVGERIRSTERLIRNATRKNNGFQTDFKRVRVNGLPGTRLTQTFNAKMRVFSTFLFGTQDDYSIGCTWYGATPDVRRQCERLTATFRATPDT